ncbi:4Fe-4S dicluster domain-containing protein [Chloroflexota bacterium]
MAEERKKEAEVAEAPAGLQKAKGYISFNPERCAGCLTCMAVCSLYHDGVVCPDLARIQVSAPVLKIFEIEGYTCKQCDSPECLWACPCGALYVDKKTGARVIDEDKCTGCNLCIKACPQYPNSPIRYNAEKKVCIKCDLCDGDPLCVKFCPKSVNITPHLYPEKDRVLKFVKTGAK